MSLPSTWTTFLLPFSTSAGREVTERAEVRMKTTKEVFPKARRRGCFKNCSKGTQQRIQVFTGLPKMEKPDSNIPGVHTSPKNTRVKSTKDTKVNSLTSSSPGVHNKKKQGCQPWYENSGRTQYTYIMMDSKLAVDYNHTKQLGQNPHLFLTFCQSC